MELDGRGKEPGATYDLKMSYGRRRTAIVTRFDAGTFNLNGLDGEARNDPLGGAIATCPTGDLGVSADRELQKLCPEG